MPGERAALAEWLHDGGFEPVTMLNEISVARELTEHPFELLIVDEELMASGAVPDVLRSRGVRRPLIVIGNEAAQAGRRTAPRDATRMTRPVAQDELMLAVSLALAEGRPARRSPRVAVPRLASTVDGLPSQLVDVSHEGLRLELAEQHRGSVPPLFTVRIPSFNVAVVAKRVWVAPASGQTPGRVWCGAVLANGPTGEAWRTLLETAPTVGQRSQVVRLR